VKKTCISKDWLFISSQHGKINVDIPHDYSVTFPRNPDCPGGAANGFFDGGKGSYKKFINFGDSEHVILNVDGAYMCSRVIINDNQIYTHPYGYTPYLVELTPKARKNVLNKLEITTFNVQPSTRWYSGAGVYRDVFIWTGGKIRIEPWDVFITTESASSEKAVVKAVIDVTSDIEANIVLNTKIVNKNGEESASAISEISLVPGKNKTEVVFEVNNPMLWDTENPNLYNFIAEIPDEDSHEVKFGIRTVTADAENGLLINGKSVKLRGGCIHHDHGAIGSAAFPAAEYRKLSKLKDAGFNAIRTAHYPPSLALLELCDELGIFVMDEAFDMWNVPKLDLDYSLWFADRWDDDIKCMVLRDRNHPCVISYSIGNEIIERDCLSDGGVWAEKLSNEIRKYDNTRFVTSALCGLWYKKDEDAPEEYKKEFELLPEFEENGIDAAWDKYSYDYVKPLDIVGYNYLYKRYERDHELYPERVMWGSETHALDFYHSWQSVMRNNYVLGDFTWTAYDNLGEAGAGRFVWERDGSISKLSLGKYPWRSCYQGDFDLCGYRRPQSYFRESIWKEDCEPRIFTTHPEHYGEGFSGTHWHWYDVEETWTFDDKYIGKPVKAEVYTDADEIRFILNGKEVGCAKPESGIATVDIPYEKGTLTAVSYKNGNKVKESSIHTVGEASQIKIVSEKKDFLADNRDLCYFEIYVCDENGDRIPHAENELSCTCDGGELMCIFSGNPANEDVYGSDKCHAFKGRALAIVRSKLPGEVKITVGSKNLKSDIVTIKVNKIK